MPRKSTTETTAPAGDAASEMPRAPKSANGDGGIRLRPDGRYEARYTGADGKRRTLMGRKGESKTEVRKRLRDAMTSRDKGLPAPTGGQTSLDAYAGRWLADTVKPNLSPNTYQSYHRALNGYALPMIGKKPLTKLTPEDIRRVIAGPLGQGKPTTAKRVRDTLRALLNQALADGLVGRNVAGSGAVKAPKLAPKEIRPLTLDEARKIAAAVRGDRLEALYLAALATGARISELLGLQWRDVDLTAHTLTIGRQLQRVDGEWRLTVPKTRASKRVIPLSPATVAALKAHQTRQKAERLAAGAAWLTDWQLVFGREEDGGPLERNTIRHRFSKLLSAAGLDPLTLHGLRHGAATVWIASGADPKTVQELLGHESLTTTLNIYTRSALDTKREAVAVLDAALGQ